MTEDEISENEWRGRLIRYAPLVLWTALVLGLSTGQASMEETSLIIRPILKFLFPTAPDVTLNLYHGYIRKLAHFTEYAVLAFLGLRAVAGWSTDRLRRASLLITVLFVAVIASIDEYHQSFVPSRTSSFWDVLLDISGGAFAVFLCWVAGRTKRVENGG